jgi:hypothetical protein
VDVDKVQVFCRTQHDAERVFVRELRVGHLDRHAAPARTDFELLAQRRFVDRNVEADDDGGRIEHKLETVRGDESATEVDRVSRRATERTGGRQRERLLVVPDSDEPVLGFEGQPEVRRFSAQLVGVDHGRVKREHDALGATGIDVHPQDMQVLCGQRCGFRLGKRGIGFELGRQANDEDQREKNIEHQPQTIHATSHSNLDPGVRTDRC